MNPFVIGIWSFLFGSIAVSNVYVVTNLISIKYELKQMKGR